MFFCAILLCSLHRKGYGVKNNLKKSAKIFGMCCFSLYIYGMFNN